MIAAQRLTCKRQAVEPAMAAAAPRGAIGSRIALDTHFSELGALGVAELAVRELVRLHLPLHRQFRLDALVPAPDPWSPDLGDGTYANPILAADYSDPDVIRVGDDFSMAASRNPSSTSVTAGTTSSHRPAASRPAGSLS